jgi:hypothetical protein
MSEPRELVDRIFDTHRVEASRDRLMRFMIDTARQLASLPEVAAHGLDVAERYWHGRGSAKELLEARVACWKFIDSIGSSTDTTDPRARATRAVICLMYEEWASKSHDAAFDLVRFFVDLVDEDMNQRAKLVAQLQVLLDNPT